MVTVWGYQPCDPDSPRMQQNHHAGQKSHISDADICETTTSISQLINCCALLSCDLFCYCKHNKSHRLSLISLWKETPSPPPRRLHSCPIRHVTPPSHHTLLYPAHYSTEVLKPKTLQLLSFAKRKKRKKKKAVCQESYQPALGPVPSTDTKQCQWTPREHINDQGNWAKPRAASLH